MCKKQLRTLKGIQIFTGYVETFKSIHARIDLFDRLYTNLWNFDDYQMHSVNSTKEQKVTNPDNWPIY